MNLSDLIAEAKAEFNLAKLIAEAQAQVAAERANAPLALGQDAPEGWRGSSWAGFFRPLKGKWTIHVTASMMPGQHGKTWTVRYYYPPGNHTSFVGERKSQAQAIQLAEQSLQGGGYKRAVALYQAERQREIQLHRQRQRLRK